MFSFNWIRPVFFFQTIFINVYQNYINFLDNLTKRESTSIVNLTTTWNANKVTTWKVCDQISVVTLTRENDRYWHHFRGILQTSRHDSYGGQRRGRTKERSRSWKFSSFLLAYFVLRAFSVNCNLPGWIQRSRCNVLRARTEKEHVRKYTAGESAVSVSARRQLSLAPS